MTRLRRKHDQGALIPYDSKAALSVQELDGTLHSYQQIVGGYIDAVSIGVATLFVN
ncbi:hypothetical protein SAMN04489747_3467 [Auraticoccus monumenti]|uniref:Uncharacterized protein n=1 Tax=Auraticoccus monumenti TaxID=675864 RepID=A0A1G7D238_9ACTN|nr:hypothetical protein SAMN04489747_3467 [Auraticoccus monumenti]